MKVKLRRMSKKERFARYMARTIKNKLYAIILIMLGVITVKIDGDATFLVLALMGGIPLFFARDRVVY